MGATLFMAGCVLGICIFFESPLIKLMVGGLTGAICYLLFAMVFRMKEIEDIRELADKIL
jgi:hypothetical protein